MVNATSGSCTGTQTTQVTVSPSPTVIVASSTICSGNSATLTATGATNYTWMPGALTTSVVVVSPTNNTTYTITGSNGVCTNSTTATVSVTSTPTLSSTSQTICAGQIATFTVSGATTYTWNPGNVTGSTYTTSPSSSGTISVVGANGSCSAQITPSITVTPNPAVAVANQTICSSQTITLTASGATTYSWNTGPTTSTISVSPASTTVYTVTGTTNLCSNTKTVSVTVVSQPTVTVANASICSGSSTILTANGATNYTWSPGGQNTSTVSVSPANTTTYTITGSAGSCTTTTTAVVNVTPTPTLIANSATICPSQTATLTVSGATTYTWNPGNITGTTYTIAPAANTTVSVVGANGTCTTLATVSVTIGSGISISVNSPTICAGETASLTASGATSYTWSSGPNTNTLNVSPASTTTYTISGMSGSCTGSNTAVVTIVSVPSVSVTSATICSGNSATLTASGATNYTWMPGGQITSSITDNPSSTTVYTVTGSNGTCTNTANGTISVTPNPTLAVNAPTVCAGQTATLTASGATTYTWNPGNLSGSSVTVNPAINTTYTLSGTNSSCTSSLTTLVTVTNCNNVSCAFNLGRDTAFCSPMNYTINGPAGYNSYLWAPGGATTQNINAINTGTYILTANMLSNDLVVNGGFTAGNTGFSSNYIVPVVPGPFGLLSNPGTYLVTTNPNFGHTNFLSFGDHTTGTGNMMVCNGASTANDIVWTETITVSPNTNYNFSAWAASTENTSAASAAQLQFSINSSLVGPVYTAPLTGGVWANFAVSWNSGVSTTAVITIVDQNTAAGGNDFALDDIFFQQVCSYSDTVIVTENITPTLTVIATNTAVCAGKPATLTASGASVYTWSGGITNGTPFIPTATTTYSVIGTSVEGCTNTASQSVTVNPLPLLTVTNATICEGQAGTISASGALTYTWAPGGAGSSQVFSPLFTSIYYVRGTDINGCISKKDSATITVNITPTVSVNSANVCFAQTVTLTATGASTYLWNTTSTSTAITVSPVNTTTYSVIGSNGTCTSSATSTVVVTSSPTLNINASSTVGCAPLCVNFTDQTSPATGIMYSFGDGDTTFFNNPSHCFTATGNYTVIATCTSSLGCSTSYTLPSVIQVKLTPVADFNITEGNIVLVDNDIHFVNASTNADAYIWTVSCTGQNSLNTDFTTAFADTGSCCMNLVAANLGGCTDTITKCFSVVREAVVVIPNVFTPNGDGRNEVFKINSSGLKSLNCTIFDRWGLKMYEWEGINGYWDGKAKSGAAPDGTYFYIINYTDQLDKTVTEKGFLNLFQK